MAAHKKATYSNDNNLEKKLELLNTTINNLINSIESGKEKDKKGDNSPFIRSTYTRDSSANYYTSEDQKADARRYFKSSNKAEKLYRDIASSRFGDTAFGRSVKNRMNFTQQIRDFTMAPRYIQKNAAKISEGMFGKGGLGKTMTKPIALFGKTLGSVTGKLSKFAGPIGLIIQGLQSVSEGFSSHFEHQAKLTDLQREYEAVQFNKAIKMAKLEQETRVENLSYIIDMNKKIAEVSGQNLVEGVGIRNQAYLAGHSARMGTLMNGITNTAYSAAESTVDTAAQLKKYEIEKGIRERYKRSFEITRGIEKEAKLAGIETEKRIAEVEAIAGEKEVQQKRREYAHNTSLSIGGAVKMIEGYDADTGGQAVNSVTGEEFKVMEGDRGEATVGMAVNNPIGKLLGADDVLKAADAARRSEMTLSNQRMEEDARANQQRVELENEYQKLRVGGEQDLTNAILDSTAKVEEANLDSAAQLKKMYLQMAHQMESTMESVQQSSNSLAKSFGYTGAGSVNAFERNFAKLGRDVFSKWGRTAEEAFAVQSSYLESTGRNIQFSRGDYDKLFAVGELTGDDGVAAELASTMEIFNHSASQSMDLVEKSMQKASQYGINARKYSKDLVKNIALANRYNFKDGVKGVMDMSMWAARTRFNMNSIGGMIDSVLDNDFENVIKKSAGFQVLGGHAAINSDPLGMFADAFSPEDYAQRMQNMTKGFGVFNEKTGETNFNYGEQLMLRQLAKLQERPLEDLIAEIRDRNKRTRVEGVLNTSEEFNEQQKALIGSKAHMENGEWVVTTKDNQSKAVSDLKKGDLDNLMPETHDEAVEDYMKDILTAVRALQGEQLFQQFDAMTEKWNVWLDNVQKRLVSSHNDYLDNREELHKKIEEGMNEASNAFGNLLTVAEKGNTEVDEALGKITIAANNIGDELSALEKIIAASNNELISLLDKPLGDYTSSETPTIKESESPVVTAVKNMALNLTSKELQERIDKYKKVKNAEGLPTKVKSLKNSGDYDDLLTLGTDGKEILNSLESIGAIGAGHNWIDKVTDKDKPAIEEFLEFMADEKNKEMLFGLTKNKRFWNIGKTKDSVMSGNGRPMLVGASNVIPIKDGAVKVASTDPNDTAIFAKSGGPFDTLFNGVFRKVDSIYNGMSSKPTNINLTINGKLELTGKGGQSVNIIQELKNNPMFVRQITEMIALQFNNNTNGGRNELWPKRFATA